MQPKYMSGTMAFMFETRGVIRPTPLALALPHLQRDYARCWSPLPKLFSPSREITRGECRLGRLSGIRDQLG
jgi:homogentisate 1,2-dioxygenase